MRGKKVRLIITRWFAREKDMDSEQTGRVEQETDRALLINGNWVPKSQIVRVDLLQEKQPRLEGKWGKVLIFGAPKDKERKLLHIRKAKRHESVGAIGVPKIFELLQRVREICPNVKWPQDLWDWFTQEQQRRQHLIRIRDGWLLKDYHPQLYPYQKRGVAFLETAGRAILADDMGLGKTVQSLRAVERHKQSKLLVVCPNSLKTNWEKEVREWTGMDARVVRGDRKVRLSCIEDYGGGALIVNYAVLRQEAYLSALLSVGFDHLVVDEAHRIKNRKAMVTEAVHKIAKQINHYVFLLTGTPIMNRVKELWSLLHTIDHNRWSSYWDFVKRHANARPGRWGWEVDDEPTNPDKLWDEIKYHFLRRVKAGVRSDLPMKTYKKEWVTLSEPQREMYDQMRRDAIAELAGGEFITAPMALTQITRLKQIAISPKLLDEDHPSWGAKIRRFSELVEDLDRAVVFSQFKQPLRLAAKNTPQEHDFVTGDVDEDERQEKVERFERGKFDVLFATLAVGGQGLNLTSADTVVFLDKHWTPAVNEQAVDRVHRHGQENPVTVVEILAEDTVEEYIESLLAKKQDISSSIIDHVEHLFELGDLDKAD